MDTIPKAKQKNSCVRWIVYDLAKGPTKTAKRLGVTNQTVFKMLWTGHALSIESARGLVALAGEHGYEVTLDNVLSPAEWTPPDRGPRRGNGTDDGGDDTMTRCSESAPLEAVSPFLSPLALAA